MGGKVLVLRTNPVDGASYGGFVWPESGPVEAPDWNDRPECGGGLHGLLWGCGDVGLLHDPTDEATVWRVVEVDADSVVDLGGKVKFPRGVVVFCGDRDGALTYLDGHGAADKPVVYATRSGGDDSTVSGGDRSTVSGGDYSTVSGGNDSTVSGGNYSTVSGGNYSTVSGGNYSTVSGGNGSTVSGGDDSTVSGGDYSTVSGGDDSTVSGGDRSTVSGGDYSTVSGGDGSTVSGGDYSIIQIKRWDTRAGRYRIVTGYIGEDRLGPNVPYRLDDDGNFVRADQ